MSLFSDHRQIGNVAVIGVGKPLDSSGDHGEGALGTLLVCTFNDGTGAAFRAPTDSVHDTTTTP